MKKNIRYIALTSIFGLALCSSIVHCGDTNSNDVDYATEQAAIKSSLLNQIRGTGVLISDKAQQNFPTETSRQVRTIKLKIPQVTKSSAMQLAERMGFSEIDSNSVSEDELAFVIRENANRRWMFMVEKASGTELAIDRDRFHSRPSSSPITAKRWSLSDNKIKEIALRFIEEHANVNMDEVVFDRFRRFNLTVGKSDGTWAEDYILDVQAVFRRKINGIPVIGRGSRIKVTVDVNGEVCGYHKLWREIDKLGQAVETVSSSVATTEYLNVASEIQASRPNVALRKAEFGYHAAGPLHVQEYLLPAHRFSYNSGATDPNDNTDGTKGKVFLTKAYGGAEIENLQGVLSPEFDAFMSR